MVFIEWISRLEDRPVILEFSYTGYIERVKQYINYFQQRLPLQFQDKAAKQEKNWHIFIGQIDIYSSLCPKAP